MIERDHKSILAIQGIATAYFTVLAILHQIGYWSAFGVNPFKYAGFIDVITYSIYPIVLSFSATPLYLSILGMHGIYSSALTAVKTRVLYTTIACLAWYCLFTLIWKGHERAQVAAGLFGLPLIITIALYRTSVLKRQIRDDVIRAFAIYLLVYMPLGEFKRGRTLGEYTAREDSGDVVSVNLPPDLLEKLPKRDFVYLGKLGEYVFLKVGNFMIIDQDKKIMPIAFRS